MQNSIWKLTALAGLVGIGFLVVLQAQRGMPTPEDQAANSASPTGEDGAPGQSQKPGDEEADVEAALLFDQHEPAEFSPADPAADDHSHSIVDRHATSSDHRRLPQSEHELADDDVITADGSHVSEPDQDAAQARGDGSGPAGGAGPNSFDEEPATLFVQDAHPLRAGQESYSDATAAAADEAGNPGTRNPFASTGSSTEVVIQQRRPDARSADPAAISPASAESASAAAHGPRLLAPPTGGGGITTGSAASPSESGLEPVPDAVDLESGDSAFGSDDSPTEADGSDPSLSGAGSEQPPFDISGDSEPIDAATSEDAAASHAAESDTFEELPQSAAAGPSALRILPADDSVTSDPGEDAETDLDDTPTVAADPFPDGTEDAPAAAVQPGEEPPGADESAEAPALTGAPFAAPEAPAHASEPGADAIAQDREPAPLPPALEHDAKPASDQPLRTVPLASDDLSGDATIGADSPRDTQQPQLTIEKKAPAVAVLGQPLVYSIVVRNVGSTPAHQVVVEDRIPKGSRLTGTIPRAELVQKKLVWKLGVLKPGEEQKIAVRIVPIEEGQIGSIATVNFVAEVAARTTITAPELELSLTGPSEARLGQPVTFTFKLVNTGEGPASGVYLRNIIPDGLRHTAGKDLEYKVGDLQPGESREVSLTVTAVERGSASNRAVATADGGISIESTADIEITGNRLRLERSGPKRRFVGRDGEFRNTIINESGDTLAAVAVVETVPPGMNFVQASHGGRWDASSRTVTWTLPRLGPQARETLTVTLAGKSAGAQSSEVHVRSAGGDEARVSSETQVEGLAALDLNVADNGSPIDVGDTVSLRIIAANRGSDAAANVRVSVTVPPEMEYVSAKGPGAHQRAAGGRIEFAPLAELAGRSQEEFLIVLKAVQAGSGDARVEIAIDADQLARPLKREEAVYILPESDSP